MDKRRFEVQIYDRRIKKGEKGHWTFLTEKQMLKFVKKNAKPNRIIIEGLEFANPKQRKYLYKVV
jgi:hypothetical protein